MTTFWLDGCTTLSEDLAQKWRKQAAVILSKPVKPNTLLTPFPRESSIQGPFDSSYLHPSLPSSLHIPSPLSVSPNNDTLAVSPPSLSLLCEQRKPLSQQSHVLSKSPPRPPRHLLSQPSQPLKPSSDPKFQGNSDPNSHAHFGDTTEGPSSMSMPSPNHTEKREVQALSTNLSDEKSRCTSFGELDDYDDEFLNFYDFQALDQVPEQPTELPELSVLVIEDRSEPSASHLHSELPLSQ